MTGNLYDRRKVIMPTPAIKRASICDRGYYVVQFARLSANTDIHREHIKSLTMGHFSIVPQVESSVLIGCKMADFERVIYLVCLADNLGVPQSIPAKGYGAEYCLWCLNPYRKPVFSAPTIAYCS